MTARGGLVALVKKGLQILTEEIIRKEDGDDFVQAIILENKRKEAIAGWYNSPCMSRKGLYDTLK